MEKAAREKKIWTGSPAFQLQEKDAKEKKQNTELDLKPNFFSFFFQ